MGESRRIILPAPPGVRAELIELDLGSMGELGQALDGLFASIMSPRVIADFGSAHYNFDIADSIPGELTRNLGDALQTNSVKKLWEGRGSPSFEDTTRRMLADETTLDLNRYNLQVCCDSTRETLRTVFNSIAKKTKRKIALPLPNWHFWQMCDEVPGEIPFTYFDARTPAELVDGFDKVRRTGEVGGLVLLSPGNPLVYELSAEEIAQIEDIATRGDIRIVIDDVMRGTRPIGQRDSIASVFQRPPYVVEGFGKRFGDGILSEASYVLVPKGEKLKGSKMCRKCNVNKGLIFDIAYEHATQPAIKELEARNAAFDRGLLAQAPEGTRVERPYASYLITLVTLPEAYPLNSYDLARCALANGASVTPLSAFYPDNHPAPEVSNQFRITVGHINSKQMEKSAAYLGSGIRCSGGNGRRS